MNLKNDCFSEEKDQASSPHPHSHLQYPFEQEKDGFSSRDNTLSDDMSLNGDGNEHVDLAKIGSKTKGITFPIIAMEARDTIRAFAHGVG
jgi:hypothetical protein